jgi:hypothetical protein
MEPRRRAAAAPGHRLALVILLAAAARALEFDMGVQTKCVYEEINANVIVVGDYKAFNKDNPSVSIAVDVLVRRPRLVGRRDALRCAAAAPRGRSPPAGRAPPSSSPKLRRRLCRPGRAGDGPGALCHPLCKGAVQGAVCVHQQNGGGVQGLLHGAR